VTWTLVVAVLTTAGLETVRWDLPQLTQAECRTKRAELMNTTPPPEYIPVGAVCVRPAPRDVPA
jgi:hypothetical protein